MSREAVQGQRPNENSGVCRNLPEPTEKLWEAGWGLEGEEVGTGGSWGQTEATLKAN